MWGPQLQLVVVVAVAVAADRLAGIELHIAAR